LTNVLEKINLIKHKTTPNQFKRRICWNVYEPQLHTLQVEELLHWLARSILKSRWEKFHNFESNCRPITLDLALFWGFPKGNIDTNVLNQSPIICNFLSGTTNDFNFVVNGTIYLWY
jgi:hypothetical protein